MLDVPSLGATPNTSVPAFIVHHDYQRQLSHGETVVVVSRIGNAGMLWQAESDFYLRLAGGYINQAITRHSDLPPLVQDLAHATPYAVRQFEHYVRQDRIGAILLDARHAPYWAGIFWRVGLHGHNIGNVIVYKTSGCAGCRALDWRQLTAGRT